MRIRVREMFHNFIGMNIFHSPAAWAVFFAVLLFSQAIFAGTVTNLNDSGEGSLRFVVENASEGESVDISVTGTIRLTDQLVIDKELTIRGLGQELLTMDGNSVTRVFKIESANVTLSGLTISGGKPSDGDGNTENGGGILNLGGSLTLEGCTVSGNTGKSGGGINNYQGILTLRNSTVSGNNAETGGGICSTVTEGNGAASVEVTDSTISDNTAGDLGGGILNKAGASGGIASLTLRSCKLSGNTAKSGGGLYNMAEAAGSRAVLEVSGSDLDQNQSVGINVDSDAKNGGGGVANMARPEASTAISVSSSVFTRNSAAEIGGAICHRVWGKNGSSVLTVSDCTFTQNTCNDFYYGGGAILNAAGESGAKSDAVISNSTFLSNTAKGDGGALFSASQYGGGVTLEVTDSTIADNLSTGVWGGGGILSGAEIEGEEKPKATLTVSRCTLSGNKVEEAEDGHAGGGGAVRVMGNNADVSASLTNCTISGNTAVMAGGGIIAGGGESPSNLRIINCTITDNTSEDGGGIYAFDPVKMRNTIVAKNTATMESGNDLSEYEAGLYASDGNNLIGDSTNSTGFANGVSGDIVGSASSLADPKLGPLQGNGGSTATHALLEGSPAINTGSDTDAPGSDQRDYAKSDTRDIGAFEYGGTQPSEPLLTVTTTAASSVTGTSAVSGGEVTAEGGADATARGVCWATSQNPTIADSKTEDGTGAGSFTSTLAELSPGTTYHVRAYATNSSETVYGNEVSFRTPLPGDVDGNGTPELKDAILALKVCVGISTTDAHTDADVNEDGKIGLAEVVFILRKVSGLR